MIVMATEYCIEGTTFSGTRARYGVLAVDPRVIPLGSRVKLHGQWFRAEDTGAYIKGRRVDIFMSDCHEAIQYGVRRHAVKVVVKR